MPETLHSCPTCNTPGFTERGLKAHRCKGINRSLAAPGSATSEQPTQATPSRALEVVAPGTLSDMTIPQLAEAGKALDRAGDLHENTTGICRLLHGLVLMEAKRKLEHGKWMPWVKENFPNSHREAGRRMMTAAAFLETVSDKKQAKKLKLDTHVQFDAQRLLLGDLAENLAEISTAQLDMSNPVVQAASAYVGKRSWTQLLLDLDHDPYANNGGHRDRPNGTNRRTKDVKEFDDKEHVCLDWYKSGFAILRTMRLKPEIAYQYLPDEELANVADILKLITKHADDTCRARRIVPSKLATWHREDAQ